MFTREDNIYRTAVVTNITLNYYVDGDKKIDYIYAKAKQIYEHIEDLISSRIILSREENFIRKMDSGKDSEDAIKAFRLAAQQMCDLINETLK